MNVKKRARVRTEASLGSLLFGDGTPRKALMTALVVGTVLTIINHGDQILQGHWPPAFKMVLTYCVPYCVTTWGAFTGKRARFHLTVVEEGDAGGAKQ